MSEKIAMTPPDQDGNQVFWDVRNVDGRELFLPSSGTPAEDKLQDFSRVGIECLTDLHRNCSVQVTSSESIFYRVYTLINEWGDHSTAWDRHVVWLRSNVMLNNAIEHPDTTKVEVGVDDRQLRVRTPGFLGAAYYIDDQNGFHSVAAMSDESEGRGSIPDELYNDRRLNVQLSYDMHRLLGGIYPGYNWHYVLYLDNNKHNILYGADKDDLVKIDVNGGKGLDF